MPAVEQVRKLLRLADIAPCASQVGFGCGGLLGWGRSSPDLHHRRHHHHTRRIARLDLSGICQKPLGSPGLWRLGFGAGGALWEVLGRGFLSDCNPLCG